MKKLSSEKNEDLQTMAQLTWASFSSLVYLLRAFERGMENRSGKNRLQIRLERKKNAQLTRQMPWEGVLGCVRPC